MEPQDNPQHSVAGFVEGMPSRSLPLNILQLQRAQSGTPIDVQCGSRSVVGSLTRSPGHTAWLGSEDAASLFYVSLAAGPALSLLILGAKAPKNLAADGAFYRVSTPH